MCIIHVSSSSQMLFTGVLSLTLAFSGNMELKPPAAGPDGSYSKNSALPIRDSSGILCA